MARLPVAGSASIHPAAPNLTHPQPHERHRKHTRPKTRTALLHPAPSTWQVKLRRSLFLSVRASWHRQRICCCSGAVRHAALLRYGRVRVRRPHAQCLMLCRGVCAHAVQPLRGRCVLCLAQAPPRLSATTLPGTCLSPCLHADARVPPQRRRLPSPRPSQIPRQRPTFTAPRAVSTWRGWRRYGRQRSTP